MSGRRAVVAGGGIAGLSAAFELAATSEVTLLEAGDRVGGKLVTTHFRGRPLDLGPDAFITRNPAALELCSLLGLGDEVITPATGSASIYARGRLRPFPIGLALGVPTDLVALARSGIVGPLAGLRALLDLVRPGRGWPDLESTARAGGEDPTVAQVVAPRLGRAVLEQLVDPLIGGINAGDSTRLSFAAAAPALASRLGSSPSLVRALRAGAALPPAGPRTGGPPGAPGTGTRGAGAPGPAATPLFVGLQGGMARLVDALATACRGRGVQVVTAAPLRRVEREAGGYRLHYGRQPGDGTGHGEPRPPASGEIDADLVVLAIPAPLAGRALAGLAPELAAELAAIPYAGVALVTAAFHAGEVRADLSGSGVLVPRRSGRAVTGITYVSSKWPRSAQPGELVVRCSLGRDGDQAPLALGDDELARRALSELASITGITATPVESVVQRWPASFPQYVSGHLARVARIEALCAHLPGLELAGAAYRGIGIPACVADGRRAASRLAESSAV